MKLRLVIFTSFFIAALCVSQVSATLIVNEVMVNEPGGYTSLEWFELYNDAPTEIILGFFQIQIGGTTVRLPGVLGPDSTLIVCRKLYGDGGTPAFEEQWGDSSGVWGDSQDEMGKAIQFSFPSLINDSGAVAVLDNQSIVSILSWTEISPDGVSWERRSFGGDQISLSVDRTGSTPGFLNSITPIANDLSLENIAVELVGDQTLLSFTVVNRGLSFAISPNEKLIVYRHNDLFPDDSVELSVLTIPDLDTAEIVVLVDTIGISGMYAQLSGNLPSDTRARNNSLKFYAPGADYPPLIITEVQPRPILPLVGEWVEIKNIEDTTIDLSGWRLGDSLGVNLIASVSTMIGPGEYLILAEDSTFFLNFYPDVSATIIEIKAGSGLNNSGDVVRLIDPLGLESSRLKYNQVYDSNYTFSRVEDSGSDAVWGRSLNVGGSPGELNEVLLTPVGSILDLEILPKVFSPDGDGYEDFTSIGIILPEAAGYTMKIFDREGREVRTRGFPSGEKNIDPDHVDGERVFWDWDGTDDNGNRLPIGFYILYFEAVGLESVKSGVVIAR